MLVGVISDTHDNIFNTEKAIKVAQQKGCEILFHCGDLISPFMIPLLASFQKEVHLIVGNNQGDIALMYEHLKKYPWVKFHGDQAFLEIKGFNVAMVHYPKLAYVLAKSQEFDYVFCGHTHKFEVKEIGKALVVNPGEVLGKEGVPTMVVLDLTSKTWEKLDLL